MKLKKKLMSIIFVTLLVLVFFSNMSYKNIFFEPIVLVGIGDSENANNNTAWHNTSYLNVTVESKRPRILWYDFQKCTSDTASSWNGFLDVDGKTWVSRRNAMTETDNDTWYRFVINISSDQGWDNIEYINISGWHDNGSDTDTDGSLLGADGYNRSDNKGANRNFFLVYDNTSNNTAYYNLTYPVNHTELTIGNFTDQVVNDPLGLDDTETHNLSFVFRPGYQFRYAPGPGEDTAWTNDTVYCSGGIPSGDGFDLNTWCWESFDNSWSWNFNITAENCGENWNAASGDGDGVDRYKSWINDEFGIYSYTEIISAGDAAIHGAPDGNTYSTNSTSHFNKPPLGAGTSGNVTVRTRSNGNYTMTINVSDLEHTANQNILLGRDNISVRGGTRTDQLNFSETGSPGRKYIYLYGEGDGDGTLGGISTWESHEVNGTCKYTGESDSGETNLNEQYPNFYTGSTYRGHNDISYTIEFAVVIPLGTYAGKYSNNVFYHLRTETHNADT